MNYGFGREGFGVLRVDYGVWLGFFRVVPNNLLFLTCFSSNINKTRFSDASNRFTVQQDRIGTCRYVVRKQAASLRAKL